MTAEDALRYLAHEAEYWRRESARRPAEARDLLEAHALLFPAVLKVLSLEPMGAVDATGFNIELHHAIRERQAVMTGADFPS